MRTDGVALSLFGVVAIVAVWAALLEMFLVRGAWFLVSMMALVWFADIGAYFTGKALGKHKLAPKVSPGKTWEGAAGGVAAAVIWVVASSGIEGSFGAVLGQRWPLWGIALVTVFLTALSIVGDLFESLLKRRAGVKDSSALLPGHGGVYDRIDALLPVAPMALLLTGVWFQ
jgi:phosphatidate cytidylyltransferase